MVILMTDLSFLFSSCIVKLVVVFADDVVVVVEVVVAQKASVL